MVRTRAIPTLIGTLAVGLFTAGCAKGPPGARSSASQELGLPLTMTEELRIDGNAVDLVSVQGSTPVSDDGTLAVPQQMDHDVLLFDSTGTRLGVVGREGRGPGEFQRVTWLGWHGDTLLAGDPFQRRFELFGPDRQLVRMVLAPQRARPAQGDAGRLPTLEPVYSGGMLMDASLFVFARCSPPEAGQEVDESDECFFRVAPDGIVLNSLGRVPNTASYTKHFSNGSAMSWVYPFPNRPGWSLAPDGSRFVTVQTTIEGARSATLHVTMVGYQGDTIYARSYPMELRPLPGSVFDSAIAAGEKRAEEMRQRSSSFSSMLDEFVPEWESRARARQPAAYPPLGSGHIIGEDGSLWIGLAHTEQGKPYLVMDSTGTPFGRATLPPDGTLGAADLHHAWVIETDSLDVPSVVRYGVHASKEVR